MLARVFSCLSFPALTAGPGSQPPFVMFYPISFLLALAEELIFVVREAEGEKVFQL